MTNDFKIIPSEKKGLNSEESYIVMREGTSFLRILGAYPDWELMTATASEDTRQQWTHYPSAPMGSIPIDKIPRDAPNSKLFAIVCEPDFPRDTSGKKYFRVPGNNMFKFSADIFRKAGLPVYAP